MTRVEPEFLDVIRYFFACKVNVGILGGRPGEAYYLIGLQDEFLIFLDPHNTQEAVASDQDSIKKMHTSYHESNAKKIHFSKLDPSLGFAFLLKKKSDYTRFKDFMTNGKKIHNKNWIFNCMETKPDYMCSKPKKSKKNKKPKKPKKDSFEDLEGFEAVDEDDDQDEVVPQPKINNLEMSGIIEESKSDEESSDSKSDKIEQEEDGSAEESSEEENKEGGDDFELI